MPAYRVTVMVTLDVEAESEQVAMSSAIDAVRTRIGDDGITPLYDRGDDAMWVIGIAEDARGYLCFEQPFAVDVIDKSEGF